MNIFGAFTFGSLIKTFLPGFVWLAALLLLDADIAQLTGRTTTLWSLAAAKEQAALVLAIPASILLGLISNIIVFMGINDVLVRDPVKKGNASLWNLHLELCGRLRTKCWSCLDGIDETHRAAFDSNIDAEIILLNLSGVEKLSYVREQYWFHLEFQLNLLLSVGAAAVAGVISILLNAASNQWRVIWAVLCVLIVAASFYFLVNAARRNYQRHLAKMASAMAAALCTPDSGARWPIDPAL